MVENIFLTEKRRKVLDGTDDLNDDSRTVEKSRIRKRAKMALKELQEVAQSEEIENRGIFEAEEVGTLIFYLQADSAAIEPVDTDVTEDSYSPFGTHSEMHEPYKRELHYEIDKQLRKFHNPEEGRF
jgi:hypothetical protein